MYLDREVFRTAHVDINAGYVCLPEGCGQWVWSMGVVNMDAILTPA